MPVPSGVLTRTLQVDPSTQVYGGASSLEVQVLPNFDGADIKLVKWTGTNQYLLSFFDVKRGAPNQGLFIDLPTVDQIGFVLGSTDEPITDWYYTIKVRYLYDGRKVGATVTKTVVPRSDTPNVIIFDQLPTGDRPNVYQGPRGYSAYQLAVLDGFVGTEGEWLDSLDGPQGIQGPAGPQGVPGVPGQSASLANLSQVFTQMIPESVWTINHSLPYTPNIVVVDSSGSAVEGDIDYLGPQTIRVSFSGAFSGIAYLS